jgi:prepilin-type processing-associated H-X9-DG protein
MYMLGEQRNTNWHIEPNPEGVWPRNEQYIDTPHPGRSSNMLYFDGHARQVRNSIDLADYGAREWETTY